jgi:acetyltransferase
MGPHYLDRLFAPRAVAVFGASDRPNSVGALVFRNLLQGGFAGAVYAINPKHRHVQGKRCYSEIEKVRAPVDMAVIATPAHTVPEIVRRCGAVGVRVAVILSAGFSEAGTDGDGLQKEIIANAQIYGMRIIGPNCLGVMRPQTRLNATFSNNSAQLGSMAFVSQSGALCTAVLDWAQANAIGFSAIVSLGDAADVDFGDILSFLAMDPYTRSIVLYIEGIRDARSFLSGLRIAARLKPVVVVKAGRFATGTRAAVSHTGALIGSDAVFHAALRRAGVVRAYTIKQMFAAAEILASRRYRVRGNRLAIVTNGGGPGVMAADRAAEMNVALPVLQENTITALNAVLPAQWSQANPVDILGDADPQRYQAAVSLCLQDPNVDGVLVMLTPQAMTQPLAAAQAVLAAAEGHDKPVLTCWMGEAQVREARALFAQQKLADFDTPEASVEAFAFLASYHRNQELLLQVPGPLGRSTEPDVAGARLIIENALAEGRELLSSMETRAILHAFGIPMSDAREANTAADALVQAEAMGFPLAMKINSPDITHKSEVGGVRLNIHDASAVRTNFTELLATVQGKQPAARIKGVTLERMVQRPNGREIMIGVARDPVFGPAISFGAGGTAVEVLQDRFVSLPPLNRFMAGQMIARTRVNRLLEAFRGMPAVNRDKLEEVLLRVSELVGELPHVVEMDINPLIVDEHDVIAVDARLRVLRPAHDTRPYAHMAIHPYPSHLINQQQLADGTNVIIRPIRPEDSGIEAEFVRNLSPQSKYFRFMRALHELTPEMLVRFTQIDYDQEMALIAVIKQQDREIEVGVARYATQPDGKSCEFAIVVADAWRGRGIGTLLMTQLMAIARSRNLDVMEGEVLAANSGMLKLAAKLGFSIGAGVDVPDVRPVSRRL